MMSASIVSLMLEIIITGRRLTDTVVPDEYTAAAAVVVVVVAETLLSKVVSVVFEQSNIMHRPVVIWIKSLGSRLNFVNLTDGIVCIYIIILLE